MKKQNKRRKPKRKLNINLHGNRMFKIYAVLIAAFMMISNEFIVSGSAAGNSPMEEAYEQYLIEQGFPESYRKYLTELHEEHPLWIFQAQHTGLDWETAVKEESVLGKNLIPNSSPVSWKSTEPGAYDSATGVWVIFDGKTWVAASKELIAYYMDPRNLLNSVNIFQFEVLSYDPSCQTAEGIETVLKGSFMEGVYTDTDGWTATYAEAFIYAAEQSKVNPYHLASRALQELGYGGSSSVSGVVSGYEGIFNFYNIGAVSSDNPILKGLEFASQVNDDYFLPWNAKWKSIAGGAIYLGNRYINVGQDTLYLQKFNVQGSNTYNHQYMTNVQAPSAESEKLYKAYGENLDRNIVFKIPVYLNMPEENAPLPGGTSPNAGLIINDPSYYGEHAIVGSDYVVMTENKILQKYMLSGGQSAEYLYGFDVGISAVEAKAAMSVINCSVNIVKADGSVNEGILSTGDSLQIIAADGVTVIKQIPIVIFGDVNGDGLIDGRDMLYICRHILGVNTLDGVFAEAADIRWDTSVQNAQGIKTTEITGVDILYIQRHILEIAYISQR